MDASTRLSFLGRLRDRSTQAGWAEFNERYRELLCRYARRRGATHAEAEDIVQDVALSVFKAMDRFQYDRQQGRFRSYLRTAVVHAMGRGAKNQRRLPAATDFQVVENVLAKDTSSDPEWEHEWRLHRLRWGLRSIANEFEAVTLQAFRLHVLADWRVDDTARHLGLTRASVYQAKSRVLKRLKAQIDSDADNDE